MDVSISSIIISAVIFAIVATPIIIDQLKKKKHRAERIIIDEAGRRGLHLDKYDVQPEAWAIGIDSDAGRLIYMSLNGQKQQDVINLRKVEKCEYIDGAETSGAPALKLHYKTSSTPCVFSFGRSPNSKTDPEEQARAWETIINKEVA